MQNIYVNLEIKDPDIYKRRLFNPITYKYEFRNKEENNRGNNFRTFYISYKDKEYEKYNMRSADP